MRNPLVVFVIENLEKPSEWVKLEYEGARRIAKKGGLLITGSGKIGKLPTEKKNSWKLNLPDPIILDPAAKEILEPEDFSEGGPTFIVIGGICGDFPPRERTADLLTNHFPGARTRSLGGLQLSIDTAVFVAKGISEGKRLSEMPFVQQVEIPVGKYEKVALNFGYPLVGGRPRITPGLKELLRKRAEF